MFSLNYHKHIHTGEGGVCVTDDERLGRRLAMIRNHAENATEWLGDDDLTNMVGFNYRMTELSAAVGLVQLRNIDTHVGRRERFAERLSEGVRNLPGLAAAGGARAMPAQLLLLGARPSMPMRSASIASFIAMR